MMFYKDDYDVIVVGAGHAGIEAALAAARMGVRTAIMTLTLDAIGNMPCNPAIGGTGKSQLVFELDALGGEMPKAADATSLESRTLNLAKGPAVHSLRVQSDRAAYQKYMKHALEKVIFSWSYRTTGFRNKRRSMRIYSGCIRKRGLHS